MVMTMVKAKPGRRARERSQVPELSVEAEDRAVAKSVGAVIRAAT